MESKFQLPTETVELPSKGLLYAKDSPLASGTIEMKYMTAKEEDILTNANYLNNGTAIDKLLRSLVVDKKIRYNDLLVGDKNAMMVAARVLSYGKDYIFSYNNEEHTVDLSTLKLKYADEKIIKDRKNEFLFKLPNTDNTVTFKLFNHDDEQAIEKEIAGLRKIDKKSSSASSTRLKYMITSVNGLTEQKDIREFVDNYMLAKDARELRKYYNEIAPDVEFTTTIVNEDGGEEDITIPITLKFFWPDF